MRFDNRRAQRAWNGSNSGSTEGWTPKFFYGLAAVFVSLVWLPALALTGSPEAAADETYRMKLTEWASWAPWMVAAGVIVAFLFRKHIRNANWLVATITSVAIGLVASVIAASLPFLAAVEFGPIYFLSHWQVTIPLSWFSFWAMRTIDRRLRRTHA